MHYTSLEHAIEVIVVADRGVCVCVRTNTTDEGEFTHGREKKLEEQQHITSKTKNDTILH